MIRTTVTLEDVGGSFKRFLKAAPRDARASLHDAVSKTAFAIQQRMRVSIHVGPDAPHIKDILDIKQRGQRAEIGILEGSGGGDPATPGSNTTMAEVGLFNEYSPNRQPWARPSAEAENADFTRRISAAMAQVERDLSGGGGLL